MCMLTDCDVSCKQRAVDGLSAEQDQFTSQREREREREREIRIDSAGSKAVIMKQTAACAHGLSVTQH